MGKVEKSMVDHETPAGNGPERLEQLKNEVVVKTADQLKDEFLAVASQASELKQKVDIELATTHRAPAEFEGKTSDKQSDKGKAVDLREVVQKIILTGQIPEKISTPTGKPAKVIGLTRTIIQKVSAEIKANEVTEQSAPYLYQLFRKAIEGEITNVDSLIQSFQEIRQFQAVNPYLFEKLQNALVEVTKSQGFSNEEARRRFEVEEIKKLGKEVFHPGSTESILYNKLEPEDKKFFLSLGSAESFKEYCQQQIEDIKDNDSEYLRVPSTDKEKILTQKLSERIKMRAASVVYKMYEHILKERKNEPIERLEQEGLYHSVSYLFSGFRLRIENLMADLSGKEFDINFVTPKREEVKLYDPVKKEFETTYKVLPIFEKVENPKQFLEFLTREIDSERVRIRYGFNLEYIMRTLAYKPEDGLMKTIAGYAQNLKSDQIDEIFLEEGGEIVQVAISLFDQRNEQFFASTNWRKNPMAMDEYFQSVAKIKEYVEGYIRKQYKGRYEEWMIERAIFNAKLIIYGMYFKPMLWYSYADPQLTGAGAPTYRGEGEMGLAVFDPGALEKRFFGKEPGKNLGVDLICKGVDFLPINHIITHYNYKDWEKFQKAWQESFQKGKAAFYPLVGEDFRGLKLFIDIGNICNAGGVDTLSSWRLVPAYKDWVRNYLDSSEAIKYSDNPQLLVEMWKRLENIGLDVLENFAEKFIVSEIPKMGDFLKDEKKIAAFKTLFEFLYERYLNTEIGQEFLKKAGGGQLTKEEFVKNILDYLTKPKAHYTKQEKIDEIRGWIYKAFSVTLFERMPLKYVLLEKQRLTQNGVTIFSELRDYAESQRWGDQFDQAIDDLVLAQTELRLKTIKEMDRLAKEAGGDRNLFGVLTDLRSSINQGRGYVLNKEVIGEILRELIPDGQRIERAVEIYTQLKNKVKQKPSEADWEKKERKRSQLEKLYISRLEWFWEMYKSNGFGFSPTSGELALKFISLSSSGTDTIKRAANWSANTAEKISHVWGGLLEKLRDARIKKDCKDIYPELLKLYLLVEAEMGAGKGPNEVILRFLQKIGYFFRKNSALPGKDILDWAMKESSSFAEEDAGGPGRLGAWEMNLNEIHKLINQFEGDLGRAIVSEYPEEPAMKEYRISEKHKFLGKIAEKIKGQPIYKRYRDLTNEISGQALKYIHQAAPLQYFEKYISPKILLILLIIALILGYKSFKEDFVIGAQK